MSPVCERCENKYDPSFFRPGDKCTHVLQSYNYYDYITREVRTREIVCNGTLVATPEELARSAKLVRLQGELEKHRLAEQKRITHQQAVHARRERKVHERSRRNSSQPRQHPHHHR